jgi:hypothetical protein
MADFIIGKLDVSKVDKTKLFEGKNGAKYLDIVLIPSPNSKYGDSHMIVQGVTQEDRKAGIKGAILGNAKIKGGGGSTERHSSPPRTSGAKPASQENLDEDVPF